MHVRGGGWRTDRGDFAVKTPSPADRLGRFLRSPFPLACLSGGGGGVPTSLQLPVLIRAVEQATNTRYNEATEDVTLGEAEIKKAGTKPKKRSRAKLGNRLAAHRAVQARLCGQKANRFPHARTPVDRFSGCCPSPLESPTPAPLPYSNHPRVADLPQPSYAVSVK